MDIYIAVLIGAIIYGLIDVVSGKHKEVFSWRYLAAVALNIVAGAACVWMLKLNEANLMFNEFDFARVIGAAFGVFGQKLFKALIRLADKNIMSKIKAVK